MTTSSEPTPEVSELSAISLATKYATERYGSAADDYRPMLQRFTAGWIGNFTKADGTLLIGGETIVINVKTGAITSYASGLPRRLVIENYVKEITPDWQVAVERPPNANQRTESGYTASGVRLTQMSPVSILVHELEAHDERYRSVEVGKWVMSPYLDAWIIAPEDDDRGRGYHYLVRGNDVLGGFAAVLETADHAYARLVQSGPLRRMHLEFQQKPGATIIEQSDGVWKIDVAQDPDLARSANGMVRSVSLYQLRRLVTPDEGDLFLEALLQTLANSSVWDLVADNDSTD